MPGAQNFYNQKRPDLKNIYETINPFSQGPITDYVMTSKEDALLAADFAHEAQKSWSGVDIKKRCEVVKNFAKILKEEKDEIGRMITEEMGKRSVEAQGEVDAVIRICEWCAYNGAKFLSDEERHPENGKKAFISYRPLGVVLSIQPWNFPLYQLCRSAIPNLIAGNAVMLKHAPNVWGIAERAQELLWKAGLARGVFTALFIKDETVSALIEHKAIKGVSFTGSPKAGSAVAKKAGQELKRMVCELGGSDPYIVLEDADVEKAADILSQARLKNSGQTCTSPKRLIVVESVYEQFRDLLVEKFKEAQMGDPSEKATRLGPLARKDLLEKLNRQVDESIEKGAKCLTGGEIEKRKGFFFQPTVLENISPGMPAYDEELFGPVALLFKAKDEDEAIKIANDTVYGLGGGVFSRDEKRALAIARDRLQTGMATINGVTSANANLPFGGVNKSGFGREHGEWGFREFTNIKTVVLKE